MPLGTRIILAEDFMKYKIERSADAEPNTKVVVEGSNPYHAWEDYRTTAGLPRAHSDDIGTDENPCVRFIINDGANQTRFYVTPLRG